MEVDAERLTGDSRDLELSAPARGASSVLRRLRNVLTLYWLAMFIGSHVKLRDAVHVFHIRDKVLHFVAYAGLAFLAAWYQRFRKGSVGWLDLGAILTLVASYGVLDEITQIPVGRTADPLDWLADAAGAVAGLTAFLAMRRFVMPHRIVREATLGG